MSLALQVQQWCCAMDDLELDTALDMIGDIMEELAWDGSLFYQLVPGSSSELHFSLS